MGNHTGKYLSLVVAMVMATALFSMPASAAVKSYRVRIVKEYPHDTSSYTQGLFFCDGQLYESTGQYGLSTFRKVDIGTGKPLRRLDFNRKYFIEGSVVLDNDLYVLTWSNRVVFIYDFPSLEYKATRSYPREGWGLTTDGTQLIASDGSASDLILVIDPDSGNVEATIDCSGLLPDSLRTTSTDVLNGIAYDKSTGKIYLTGKNWPRLYEVRLEEK